MAKQLKPTDIVSPGSLGLNFSKAASILSPVFATAAENAVIDASGRLAARRGHTVLTTTGITNSPTIKTMHEYVQHDGSLEVIIAWDGGIANNTVDPEGNDISGSVTDTDGTWHFQNFNNKVVGFQDGQKLIVYTGTGTFATVTESSGTAPSGGIGLAAYGRIWQLDSDGTTIKYSGLLDETDWGGAGAGLIDMSNIWTDGTDEVRAIAAFNGFLVVFGRRHIVFWTDGIGSELGLNPANIYVSDIISGTGTESQFTLQSVGDTDLIFLSSHGVQSLQRVVQEKSNPVATLSKAVGYALSLDTSLEDYTNMRSVYSPLEGFYLLTLPTTETTWVFDQRRKYADETGSLLSPVTRWDLAPTSWLNRSNHDIYLGTTAGVSQYTGNVDNALPIRFIYHSPWLDLGEDYANYLKMLKRIGFVLFANTSSTVIFKWYTDFSSDFRTQSKDLISSVSAEWGEGEWNAAEWGGGLTIVIIKIPARSKGQYFRIAIEAEVSGPLAVQQAELLAKLGRIA